MSSPTIRDALGEARGQLGDGADDPGLEAQVLLGHVLGRSRAWLIAHGDDPLPAEARRLFRTLVQRRAAGEPVAYLLGRREFWSLELQVTPAVLIPRPDTECLVERALALLPPHDAAAVCDLGTGSGAVAIAIAVERPRAGVLACDASPQALAVAAANTRRLAPGRIHLWRGDWLDAVAGACLDLIVSNPPYVEDDDVHLTQGDVRFEPGRALKAGRDGLQALRRIAADAPRCLRPGGWLTVEHGARQGDAVRALLRDTGLEQVTTHRDLGGNERVTQGRRPETGAAWEGV